MTPPKKRKKQREMGENTAGATISMVTTELAKLINKRYDDNNKNTHTATGTGEMKSLPWLGPLSTPFRSPFGRLSTPFGPRETPAPNDIQIGKVGTKTKQLRLQQYATTGATSGIRAITIATSAGTATPGPTATATEVSTIITAAATAKDKSRT